MRSSDSCATLLCCKNQLRNNIFVDIPWQQTTVGLLLPAGNAVSFSLCLHLSKLHWSKHPPRHLKLLIKQLHHVLDLFSNVELALNLQCTTFKACLYTAPTLSLSLLIFTQFSNGHRALILENDWNLYKAHTCTLCNSLKYRQPAFIRLQIQYI